MKLERALDRAILVAAMVLLSVGLSVRFTGVEKAQAHHPHSWHNHISTVHSNVYHEDFCVQVYSGHHGHQTVLDAFRNTYFYDNYPASWDGLSSNRIYFDPYYQPCDSYSQDIRNQIEIFNYVQIGGNGGTAYTELLGYYYEAGHESREYARVWYKPEHFDHDWLRRHVINHETGHVLGLKDPDYYGHCMGDVSVMHSTFRDYGCRYDREWPTWYDHDSVVRIAENR
jgi:hypothetical protein